jgi:Uma2 family endonuclease
MEPPVEKKLRYTLAEYLEMEKTAVEKHEFYEGEIRSLSCKPLGHSGRDGGMINHSLIMVNVIGEMRNRLKGKPCKVFDSKLRVRIPGKVLYISPDLSVIRGSIQKDPDDTTGQTVVNPRLIVEVLSPTTEAYDRGEKFRFYREIESLEEYVLISQSSARVETFYRQADGTWLFSAFAGIESKATLRSLEIELSLAEVFEGVEFPKPEIGPGISA